VSTWKGIKVQHADGRAGVIDSEWDGFLHRGLKIAVDGGGESFVQLNSNGRDTGDAGWSWWCENFAGGAGWLPLGDHCSAAA
jgi:hypothetical protein